MKYLKTYGKQKTILSSWVSIQDRKEVFDSTSSSEADPSANQASKPSRTRLKPGRPAGRSVRGRKRKPLSLSVSSDEENIVPLTQKPKAPNHRRTRRKKSTAANQHTAHSDERCPLEPYQSREKPSSSNENTSLLKSNTVQRDSRVHLPSAGRFVTRRRCAILSSSELLILNSSESAPLRPTSQNNQKRCPSKKKLPSFFLESSADNSANAAVLQSFARVPHREISLNESVEHSFGPCSRKPIFCSTPSAVPLTKKSKLRSFNPVSSPASISVSCIGPVSIASPEPLTSSQHASSHEASIEKQAPLFKKPSQLHDEEMSDSLIVTHSKGTHDKSPMSTQNQSKEGQSSSPALPSMITIGSDVSSYFTFASGEREWLTDFLKAKCLTQLCTVRLERIDDLIHLFSETTYSSCLGDLESVCSSSGKEHSLSGAASRNTDHVKDSEPCHSLKLATCEVPDVVFVSDSQCTEPSMSDGCTQSEHKSTIDLFSESTNSCTDVVDMQAPDITELSSIIMNKCLSRECSVKLKKLPQSSIVRHLTPKPKLSESEPQTEAAELIRELKDKCLNDKSVITMKKMSITEIKHELQENMGSDRSVGDLVSEETESESNCTMADLKVTSVGMGRKRKSASSNDRVVSNKDVSKKSSDRQSNKRKKISLAPKEKSCRTSTHQPAITRKACVSGLSVSRWKSRDAFTTTIGQRGGTQAIDCSIRELIPSQHSQPVKLTDRNMGWFSPVKGHNLNFSHLADLTPNTHTWSRLKAALSVHRKVILTPKTPGSSRSSRMTEADLSQDLFATPFRAPLPKHLRSRRSTHESQLVFDNDEISDAEKVYAECGQTSPLAWDECLLPQRMKRCVKIGEGTFGEVFSTTSGKPDGEIVALKVIPVEGSEKVNGEEQKTFGEILHEIIISKELSCLKEKENNQTSGFIGLRDLHCVKGGYPPEFLNAWDKFDKEKGSENDRPDFFEKEQLFIILEFEFGGTDLENSNGTLPSILVAKSILHQVTAALAVAEQELQFEHRDLHWGNVLVKVTKQKTFNFSLNGAVHALETKGVLIRIIDYSLSRLEIDELTVSCDISNDDELFMGQGDYQFEIYRLMKQENGNEWSSYNPHSNVLWLHYLCSKLLDMKYRGSGGKRNKDMRGELTSFYDNVLQFSSATEVLQHSPLFQ